MISGSASSFDADPDPTFHFDADPDHDHTGLWLDMPSFFPVDRILLYWTIERSFESMEVVFEGSIDSLKSTLENGDYIYRIIVSLRWLLSWLDPGPRKKNNVLQISHLFFLFLWNHFCCGATRDIQRLPTTSFSLVLWKEYFDLPLERLSRITLHLIEGWGASLYSCTL